MRLFCCLSLVILVVACKSAPIEEKPEDKNIESPALGLSCADQTVNAILKSAPMAPIRDFSPVKGVSLSSWQVATIDPGGDFTPPSLQINQSIGRFQYLEFSFCNSPDCRSLGATHVLKSSSLLPYHPEYAQKPVTVAVRACQDAPFSDAKDCSQSAVKTFNWPVKTTDAKRVAIYDHLIANQEKLDHHITAFWRSSCAFSRAIHEQSAMDRFYKHLAHNICHSGEAAALQFFTTEFEEFAQNLQQNSAEKSDIPSCKKKNAQLGLAEGEEGQEESDPISPTNEIIIGSGLIAAYGGIMIWQFSERFFGLGWRGFFPWAAPGLFGAVGGILGKGVGALVGAKGMLLGGLTGLVGMVTGAAAAKAGDGAADVEVIKRWQYNRFVKPGEPKIKRGEKYADHAKPEVIERMKAYHEKLGQKIGKAGIGIAILGSVTIIVGVSRQLSGAYLTEDMSEHYKKVLADFEEQLAAYLLKRNALFAQLMETSD